VTRPGRPPSSTGAIYALGLLMSDRLAVRLGDRQLARLVGRAEQLGSVGAWDRALTLLTDRLGPVPARKAVTALRYTSPTPRGAVMA
jgi:hypothetical protein